MNITDDMIEILIGKYLDGEITPSEQRMLDGAMKKDAGVRELLEQLEQLHERCGEVVGSQIIEKGRSAEAIIERAWRRSDGSIRRVLPTRGWWRFAAGLAAGFVIGVALHFALSGSPAAEPMQVAGGVDDRVGTERIAPLPTGRDVIRNVDYFGFTDNAGDQWLVEGLRENVVRPAVYYGDL